MGLGFGSSRKAARLEVEVAGNTEDFDKSMKKVRSESKATGEAVTKEFSLMSRAIRLSLKILVARIVIGLSAAGIGLFRLFRKEIQAALGAKALATVNALTNSMRGLGAVVRGSVGTAIATVVSRMRLLVSATRGSTAFRAIAAGATQVSGAIGVAAKTIGTFARIVSGPAFRAVSRFSGVLSRALFGAFDIAALGARGLGKGLKVLGARLREEGKLLSAFGIALGATGDTMERVGKIVGKVIGLMVKFKAVTVLTTVAIAAMSAKVAGEFNNSFARVKTLLLDMTDGELVQLRSELAAMRRELGVTSDELNNTFYQTLSAMPHLVNDATRALEILEVATKVSATGFADGEVAIRAITGIMNAWKLESEEAIEVADALFAAQNQGVTTFGEIAESIGSVTGLTAALGGEWRDLLGIIATVSPFIATSEVLTGVSAVLAGVLEASPVARAEASKIGLDFNVARIEAIGLIPFIREIVELSNGNPEIIAKLFGRKEASQLVITLAQNMDELETKTQAVVDSQGTLGEVFEITEDTSARAGERMKEAFNGLLDEMGGGLTSVVIDVKDAVTASVNALTTVFDIAGKGIDMLLEKTDELSEESAGPIRDLLGMIAEFDRKVQQRRIGFQDAERERRFHSPEAVAAREAAFRAPRGAIGSVERRLRGENVVEVNFKPVFDNPILQQLFEESVGLRPSTGFLLPPIIDPETPIDLESARGRVATLTASLEAMNKVQFALTGDQEAYTIATREAQESVNALVLAERRRFLDAGLLEDANQLMALYGVIAEESLGKQEQAAKTAADSLDGMLFGLQALSNLGIEAFADQRPEISALSSEFLTLTNELLGYAEVLENLDAGDGERRQAALDRIEAINDRRDALAAEIDVLREMEPIIEAVGLEFVQLGDSLPTEQAELFTVGLETFVAGLADLQVAQLAYDLAVAKFGKNSDQAKLAQTALTAAVVKMKALMREVIVIMEAAGLATDAMRIALEKMEAAVGNLDPDSDEGGGGFFGWISENAGDIEGVARGLLAVGDALGVIDSRAKQALTGVADLAAGVARIKSGDVVGGAVQSIGGVIGIAKGLFGGGGDSEAEKERKASLEKNSERLRRLSESIDDLRGVMFNLPGKLTADTSEAIVRGFLGRPVRATDSRARGAGETQEQFDERVQKFLKNLQEGIPADFSGVGTGRPGSPRIETVTRDIRAQLDAAGVTITDLENLADLVGVEIDQLIRLVQGKDLNAEQLREAVEQSQSLLNGLTLGVKNFFDTIAGRVELANRRIALFDIDKPIDQIEKLVDVIAASGTGLSEDQISRLREGDESLIQELFEQLVSKTGLFADGANLGDFTPQEFIDILSDIESAGDRLNDGPDSTSFQEFRGITEITANRLAGLLTTDVYWNEITAQNVRAIVTLLGGTPLGAEPSTPAPNYNPDIFPGPGESAPAPLDQSITIQELLVEVSQVNPDMDADELAIQVVAAINTELGNGVRRQVRSAGTVTTRTVR